MAGMSIDRQKLQELLRDFRTLTGICISFWYHGDEWSVIGDTVYASPFCALLRQNETMRAALLTPGKRERFAVWSATPGFTSTPTRCRNPDVPSVIS